ncbi:hypothetical protein [Priestia koreensis]|uniref:hypothetical protein n=1 Tax=Priestia koreensis TaxID=284581 RepID=UPI00203D55FD|nr:hypothetical protein [Priestia koreensis]MCM3006091.1 hypothetical protein [Priestia koreensis]
MTYSRMVLIAVILLYFISSYLEKIKYKKALQKATETKQLRSAAAIHRKMTKLHLVGFGIFIAITLIQIVRGR